MSPVRSAGARLRKTSAGGDVAASARKDRAFGGDAACAAMERYDEPSGGTRDRSRSPERGGEDKPRRSRFSDAPAGFTAAPSPYAPPPGEPDALQKALALAASLSGASAGVMAAAPPVTPIGYGAPPARGPPPGEPPPPYGKMMGTVKNFNMEKGFGFIIPDDGTEDIFAHGNSLTDGNALREGTRVCFRKDFDASKNKGRAEDVTGAYTDPSRPPPRLQASAAAGGAAMVAPVRSTPSGPLPGEAPPPAGKLMGTVKTFNGEKGFGFIGALGNPWTVVGTGAGPRL